MSDSARSSLGIIGFLRETTIPVFALVILMSHIQRHERLKKTVSQNASRTPPSVFKENVGKEATYDSPSGSDSERDLDPVRVLSLCIWSCQVTPNTCPSKPAFRDGRGFGRSNTYYSLKSPVFAPW